METVQKSPTENLKKYYLLCLTLDGIPIFTRSHGDVPNLPFSYIGSLNAVHMFTQGTDVILDFTKTENSQVFWKEYAQIKLIIVLFDTKCTKKSLQCILDNIYNCLIMCCGENEFKTITNIEKLKRKVKLAFPLIATYVTPNALIGNITQMTDIVLTQNANLLLQYLNAFTDECESEFACLLVHGKVVVATDQFWELQAIETFLILCINQTLHSTSCDIPIYLPNGSPTIPHRLVIIKLIENIHVALVCGPQPSLQAITSKYVKKYWGNITSALQTCLSSYPRDIPSDIRLDDNVLSYILLYTREGKCLSSFYPHGNMTGADQDYMSNVNKRKEALIGFYRTSSEDFSSEELPHKVLQRYSCTNKYKCFALQTSSHEIYVLFKIDIATYIMKSITKQVMKQLLRDRTS